MNKNPFEVRLDIMKMAQEMLDREVQIEQSTYFTKVETLRSSNAPVETINSLPPPKMYSPEDVVARASTLYSFVNNSTSNATASVGSNTSSIKKDTK